MESKKDIRPNDPKRMELGKRIIKELKNNPALKDFFLFAFVTIVLVQRHL